MSKPSNVETPHFNFSQLCEASMRQKCPACPGKTERMFDRVGLLQHALMSVSVTKGGDVANIRSHSTLLRGLTTRMSDASQELEWQNMLRLGKKTVNECFGWIADEKDYTMSNPLAEFLHKSKTPRNVPQSGQFSIKQHNQLLHDMRSQIQKKNLMLYELGKENSNLRGSVHQAANEKLCAESKLLLSEAKHKQEIEALHESSRKSMQMQNGQLARDKERINSLELELKALQKKCQELQEGSHKAAEDTMLEQLADLVEEKEVLEETLQILVYRETEANSKIQNATKACVEILKIKGDNEFFVNKQLGALNYAPWIVASQKKFKNCKEGWEMEYKRSVSKWEETLQDASWYPYKTSTSENGMPEEKIDDRDSRLVKLREDWGADVYTSVVVALNELMEYNGSTRIPVPVPWNLKLDRPAYPDEILRFLAAEGLDVCKKRRRLL